MQFKGAAEDRLKLIPLQILWVLLMLSKFCPVNFKHTFNQIHLFWEHPYSEGFSVFCKDMANTLYFRRQLFLQENQPITFDL